ncbi:AfsR/SARP family transcriptional regulator [Nakamurella lactea]|uniref:AfsR/SARP family transcriptional regulator n=1 Tax=Nakamurella lactea TaxID=459515 RepID=UPI000684B086|nr:BTAD domain-containing putative transcriptional regulator [Nakamurella lactea]
MTETIGYSLRLLDSFQLTANPGSRSVRLPPNGRRLIALLAVVGIKERCWLAGTLWPDHRDTAAMASLRTTMWRVLREAPGLLDGDRSALGLGAVTDTDLLQLLGFIDAALDGRPVHRTGRSTVRCAGELLPGWYDDWARDERERLRNLRVAALERLCATQLREDNLDEALALAMAGVAADPLRDSTHRLLIEVHLRQGNASAAVLHFDRYRQLLERELGLPPSAQIRALIDEMFNGLEQTVLPVVGNGRVGS